MDPIKIDIDVDSRPSPTTISSQLTHMEQESEEEMHIPFAFVDVNGHTDIDLELDVDPHPASSFSEINHEEALSPFNYDTLKSEDEERQLADKAVLKVEDEKMGEQEHEMDLEGDGTLRELAAFQCKVCNKGFRHKTELKMHSRTHTGWVNYSRVHLSDKPHLIDHSYCITGSKTQLCHLCNKEFTKLQEHYRTHTGEKPYKCGVCGKLFSIRGSLKRHLTVHTGDKRHQCNVCFKRLSSKRSLRNHELMHENRLYECQVCHAEFSRSKNLIIHSRLHCEENCNTSRPSGDKKRRSSRKKNIRCEICFKRVSNKGNLFQHYLTHEKGSSNPRGVKPFKCNICSRRFSSVSAFKRHSRMHS